MVESYSSLMIELTATNYSLWKSMMEDLLHCKDLYDPIEGAKSSDMPDVDWKKLKIKHWVSFADGGH